MVRRLLCCTDNLLALPVCGVFLILIGIILFILYLVAEDLTTSLEYIDDSIPVWVPAILLLVTGISMILLSKKHPIALLAIALCLSTASAVVCIAIAVPTILNTIPLMESLTLCVYQQSMAECRCYVVDSKHNGTNLINIPEGSQQYTFKEVKGCDSVERTLKDIVFTECVIYGFGAFACLVAAILTSLLLCHERKSHKSPVQHINNGVFENSNNHRFHYNNNRMFIHGTGQPYVVGPHEDQDQNSLINSEVIPQEERSNTITSTTTTTTTATSARGSLPAYGGNRTAQAHHVRRSISSSSSAVPRPVQTNSRHHTISSADVTGHGTRGSRPTRQPHLVHGGFMQSHPDGRAVPVYTLPGSNQAYISLNDLPSLQMPNMNSVPAYTPTLPTPDTMQFPYPNEQPPPYSPSVDYPGPSLPAFTELVLTTVNEETTVSINSPESNQATVEFPDVATILEDGDMDSEIQDQHTNINLSLNENVIFSNFDTNDRQLEDPTSVTLTSSEGDQNDVDNLSDQTESEIRILDLNNQHSETKDNDVGELSSVSQHRWNCGTSSRESLAGSSMSHQSEPSSRDSVRSSVENLAQLFPSLEELNQFGIELYNQLPLGARPKTGKARPNIGKAMPNAGKAMPNTGKARPNTGKARPNTGKALSNTGKAMPNTGKARPSTGKARPSTGKARPNTGKDKQKMGKVKASSISRLQEPECSSGPSLNSNWGFSDSHDDTNDGLMTNRTVSMPNLTRPSPATSDNERLESQSNSVEKSSQKIPELPWAFDCGTIDGRRKKNMHRNTRAFYDLIEHANKYHTDERVLKPPCGKQRQKEHISNKQRKEHISNKQRKEHISNKQRKNVHSLEYDHNHTNPRQKAKIRTDLPASSAWDPKVNIPSISGRASKARLRAQLVSAKSSDKYNTGLSSSSNESLTDVISLVAKTSTSSTRAQRKRVMQEAQSITELLDTRV